MRMIMALVLVALMGMTDTAHAWGRRDGGWHYRGDWAAGALAGAVIGEALAAPYLYRPPVVAMPYAPVYSPPPPPPYGYMPGYGAPGSYGYGSNVGPLPPAIPPYLPSLPPGTYRGY